MGLSASGFGAEKLLNLFKGLSVDDGRVLAREPFVLVSGLADVEAVLQEVGEGTVSEGYPAVPFLDFGIAALGDDAPA